MRTYYYTIDEMVQIIAEHNEMERIITEYKATEGIECITEEEFTDLFGESTLYPNIYYASPYEGYDYAYVSDYDWHLLGSGFNPFTGEYFDITEWPACHIIKEVDTINPADVAQDLCWTDANLTFEEALAQATIMDRQYLIVDDNDNIIGSGLFEVGNNFNEYLRIKGLDDDYDFMKVEEPDILDEGEWECSLAEELEYCKSLRKKIIEVYVTDADELTNLLQSTMDETIYRLKIHLNTGGLKFLIIVTDMDQFFWYKVLLKTESGKRNTLKYLGSDCNAESVLFFIDYYFETGQPLHVI